MTDAEKCRRCRWGPGTVLKSPQGSCYENRRILITAVGEELVLGRCLTRRYAGERLGEHLVFFDTSGWSKTGMTANLKSTGEC